MPAACLGIDIGSTTVKVVALDAARQLLAWRYVRSCGRPRVVVAETIAELGGTLDLRGATTVGLSGSGGGPIADLIGGTHVNELVAQTRAVGEFHSDARTIIEIGGQDSKLLSLRWDEGSRQMMLEDFAMNALCAAGTGAFLDQQAERLGVAIDGEFAQLAMQSVSPPRIAGRCTVFAKSDMIHLQQVGTPMSDILMGVCLAMARNFTTVIGKGKRFVPPILFQGGVAYNAAVKRAFEMVLGVEPGSIIVPEHHTIMAALGAAYVAMDERDRGAAARRFVGVDQLEGVARGPGHERARLAVLARGEARGPASPSGAALPATGTVGAWLGVDVGSVSTNVVLIDDANRVLARRYLMTAGRPLEAVREGLRLIAVDAGDRVAVRGVGATGSGRSLTGDFIGADAVRNEITAQARAAAAADPAADTVIEIGGQDSKFIRLHNGAVTDFTMNNACAAGTGSFLQEQADRLQIRIEEQFSDLAFGSSCPAALGERCTVFMESDLVHHQQQGARVSDLTAGLAYSIAENYLNRVVNGRPLGSHIMFQGGVASNAAVVAAFSRMLGRPVNVPPNHDVTGAIGAAILAREEMARRNGGGAGTRFRGFDLSRRRYESTVFECKACPNLCEVHKVALDGAAPFFYGARCDKFEEAGREVSAEWRQIPDLFAEREALLLQGWTDPGPRRSGGGTPRLRVGLLRNLTFFDFFPFWRAFLSRLGCDVVLSGLTTPALVRLTQQRAVAESCFPVKLAYGHLADVAAADVDLVLVPSLLNREDGAPGQPYNHYCPLISAVPHLLDGNRASAEREPRIVHPVLHLANERAARIELRALAGELTGASRRLADRAALAGWAAQRAFAAAVAARGRSVLEGAGGDVPWVVVVGRPYTANDPGANLDLPYRLRRLGVLPIPMDFLPLDGAPLPDLHDEMYWRSGQQILRAAAVVRDDPRLQAIYLTSFNCGPDAFLITFFRQALGDKPFLELELDDHTADAGLITRCEAFFDSLGLRRMA
ncbi:MAG TPA: acyl-CoA dehydratase activase [Gemmatimonadaceae bacterium]|nr:acyl-CoA dehydratase activase [Gemmatimonadaceae bacterium]